MPNPHLAEQVAGELAQWLEDMPGKVASDYLRGGAPPWNQQLTQDQAANFWRYQLFDKNGVPQVGPMADFVQTYGAKTLAKTVKELNSRGLLDYPTDSLPNDDAVPGMPQPPANESGVMGQPGQDLNPMDTPPDQEAAQAPLVTDKLPGQGSPGPQAQPDGGGGQ